MRPEHDDRAPRLRQVAADAAALLAGDSGTSRNFLGGLIAGALVGAAVAGAMLVRSRRTPPLEASPARR